MQRTHRLTTVVVFCSLLTLGLAQDEVSRAQAPPGEGIWQIYLPYAPRLFQPDLEIMDQEGGISEAVAAMGELSLVGAGPRLLVYGPADTGGELALLGRSQPLPGIVRDIAVDALRPGRVVVALGDAGLAALDLGDPSEPQLLAQVELPAGGAEELVAIAGHAFTVDNEWPYGQAWTVGYEHRDGPRVEQLWQVSSDGFHSADDLEIHDRRLYLVERYSAKVHVFDLSEPDSPTELYSLDFEAQLDALYHYAFDIDMVVADQRLRLAYQDYSSPRALSAEAFLIEVDIRNIDLPRLSWVHALNDGGRCWDVALASRGPDIYAGCGRRSIEHLDNRAAVKPRMARRYEQSWSALALAGDRLLVARDDGGVDGFGLGPSGELQAAGAARWPGRFNELLAREQDRYGIDSEGRLVVGHTEHVDDLLEGSRYRYVGDIEAYDLDLSDAVLAVAGPSALRLFALDDDPTLDAALLIELPEAPGRRVLLLDQEAWVVDGHFDASGLVLLHRVALSWGPNGLGAELAASYRFDSGAYDGFVPTAMAWHADQLLLAGDNYSGRITWSHGDSRRALAISSLYRIDHARIEPPAGIPTVPEPMLVSEQLALTDGGHAKGLVVLGDVALLSFAKGVWLIPLDGDGPLEQLFTDSGVVALAAGEGLRAIAATEKGLLYGIDLGSTVRPTIDRAGRIAGRAVSLSVHRDRLHLAAAEAGWYVLFDRNCDGLLRKVSDPHEGACRRPLPFAPQDAPSLVRP